MKIKIIITTIYFQKKLLMNYLKIDFDRIDVYEGIEGNKTSA